MGEGRAWKCTKGHRQLLGVILTQSRGRTGLDLSPKLLDAMTLNKALLPSCFLFTTFFNLHFPVLSIYVLNGHGLKTYCMSSTVLSP